MRLIDADLLKGIPIKDKLERNYQTFNLDDAYEEGWFDAIETIEKQPTVDTERHGHWIPVNPDVYGAEQFECSVCGVYSGDGLCRKELDYEYCPNCGAKMEGVEEDE